MTERSPRISVVLSRKVMDALDAIATPQRTRSKIVQEAVASYLGVEPDRPLRVGGFANMDEDELHEATSLGGKKKAVRRSNQSVQPARKRRKS